MKKVLSLLLLSCFFVSCSNAQRKNFKEEAFPMKLKTENNADIGFQDVLNKAKGKVTVIEFWASWCSDCVKAMPDLKRMQAAHPDVNFVFISFDKSLEKWIAGIERHELKGTQYWSPEGMKGAFGQALDIDWIPRYIILDKEGKIITYRAIEKDFEAMNNTLTKLKS